MGKKGIGAAMQHPGRKITHDRLSLNMQVSQHFIGAPAPDETDAIGIDIGTQEGHGAGGAEGAGRDVLGHKIVSGAEDGHGQAEGGSEVGGAEAREPEGDGVEERGQWLGGCCLGCAQV